MKLLKSIATIAMLSLGTNAFADEAFYIADETVVPGTQATMSVMFDNDSAYTSCQFNVYLPEGVDYVYDEDGEVDASFTSRQSKHVFDAGVQSDGSMIFIIYSMNNNVFKGNSGAIFTINVNVSADFSGTKKGRFGRASAVLKNENFDEIEFPEREFTLTADTETAINDIDDDANVALRTYAGGVAIDGADSSARATVYNLAGEAVYDGFNRNIPLSQGIYILKLVDRTFKFAIK
jgi:hypothetical protein